MRFKDDVISATWTRVDGEPRFKLLKRSKRVKFKHFDFDPYCYILRDQLADAKPILEEVSRKERIDYEIERVPAIDTDTKRFVVKISTTFPSDVKKIRLALESKGIKVFEADIPFVRRHLIDVDDVLAEPKRILYFDLEVAALGKFPDVELADQRIISIAAVGSDGREYFFSEDKEVDMILDFLDVTKKYDVICAWNADTFDIPYLVNRAQNLGIRVGNVSKRYIVKKENGKEKKVLKSIRIFECPHIDLLKVFKTIFKRKIRSYALKAIAKDLLGKEEVIEIETREDMKKLWESFLGDKKLLREYNIQDVLLLKELDQETRLVDFQYTMTSVCHLESYEPRGMSTYVESYLLYLAGKRDPRLVFRSRVREESANENDEDDEEGYKGGYVKDPVYGVHKNVAVLDLARTYPAIIETFNVGLETWREDYSGDIIAPHGSFINSVRSIFAEGVHSLQALRDYAKKMRNRFDPTSIEYKIWDYRQFGYKFLINTFYGVLGFEDSRLYRKEIAENITLYARAIIKALESLFKNKVLYADTDSLFLKLPDKYDIDQCVELSEYLSDYINRYIKKWIHIEFGVPVDQIQIEIKTDRIADVCYLPPVKKRYGMHVVWEDGKTVDYFHIKGFDCVRGNVPLLCREIQENVLKHILQLKPLTEIRDLLEDYKRRLFAGEFDDKLVMYVTIRKDLDEYKRTARHIEAAKMLQKLGYQVVVGDKICFIDVGERAIPYIPGETKLSKKDYEAFWNNKVISVLENLHLNIDWSTFTKQKTLADF
jgi:DNA polymerase I